MRRPARAHVIFGVDFEKADIRPRRQDFRTMLRLQPDAEGAGGDGGAIPG